MKGVPSQQGHLI